MKLGASHPMGPLQLPISSVSTCLAIMQVLHDGLSDSKYRPCSAAGEGLRNAGQAGSTWRPAMASTTIAANTRFRPALVLRFTASLDDWQRSTAAFNGVADLPGGVGGASTVRPAAPACLGLVAQAASARGGHFVDIGVACWDHGQPDAHRWWNLAVALEAEPS